LRAANDQAAKAKPAITYAINRAQLIQANCFDWLRARDARSIHAIVTDPPYGLVEYSHVEQTKLRDGCGGVWRIPPSFDGHQRAPLPRFTELDEEDLQVMHDFFFEFGQLALRVTVGRECNPLLAHVVAAAMGAAGLELRGYIIRLVMTMRGGDRPKNAHKEFREVSAPWITSIATPSSILGPISSTRPPDMIRISKSMN
jgi:hypothetical protein